MSSQKEAEALRWERTIRRVALTAASRPGLTLGDLRKVVRTAEGMGDAAEVTTVELTAHPFRKEEWCSMKIRVTEEAPNA